MIFEFPEDKAFFENLLCEQNKNLSKYEALFDFRSPKEKRTEFNAHRRVLREKLIRRYGKSCQLQHSVHCDMSSGIHIDHLIPLASNVLNKKLRRMISAKVKKVAAQSFGSNDLSNLILACSNCNNHKKHRFLSKAEIKRILNLKDSR